MQPWTWGINGLFKLKQFDYSHRRFADFKMDLLKSESLHRSMCRFNFSCNDHADLLWGYPPLTHLAKVNQNWSFCFVTKTKEKALVCSLCNVAWEFSCLFNNLIKSEKRLFFLSFFLGLFWKFQLIRLFSILVLSNHFILPT